MLTDIFDISQFKSAGPKLYSLIGITNLADKLAFLDAHNRLNVNLTLFYCITFVL